MKRISGLPAAIFQETGEHISGRRCREAAVDARIPARQINHLWHFDPADLPVIVRAFGLQPRGARKESIAA